MGLDIYLFVLEIKMPGKDKVDLRQCVELLTEMLESEGGTCLFLKLSCF